MVQRQAAFSLPAARCWRRQGRPHDSGGKSSNGSGVDRGIDKDRGHGTSVHCVQGTPWQGRWRPPQHPWHTPAPSAPCPACPHDSTEAAGTAARPQASRVSRGCHSHRTCAHQGPQPRQKPDFHARLSVLIRCKTLIHQAMQRIDSVPAQVAELVDALVSGTSG